MGNPIWGVDPVLAHRGDRVLPLPRLRYRDQNSDLFDERDRIIERPLPASRPGPRAFPERAGRAEMPVPCDPQPGPDRYRPRPMDDALEARAERLRHHLRCPLAARRDLLTEEPETPILVRPRRADRQAVEPTV